MEVKVCRTSPIKQKTDCLILGVFENGFSDPALKELDRLLDGGLGQARRSGEFSGKSDECLLLHAHGRLPATRILLVGLGASRRVGSGQLRKAAAVASGSLKKIKLHKLTCALSLLEVPGLSSAACIRAVAEGLLLANYRFERYQTEKERALQAPPGTTCLLVKTPDEKAVAERAVEIACKLVRGVNLARDLVNEPGNIKSPAFLADQARSIADETNITCRIMERDAMRQAGMGALLGVAQGSERAPCLITLEYHGGPPDEAPVALVGKGVVFDAGGISLKPADKMDEMKMDMAGAAAVIGTLLVAALLELPVNLVGVIPAVENLPSGSAIRPGDILTSLSGQTIEVLNTDAEGRMILADALSYVKRFEPRLVIDLATLTGACIIALGHHATAVLGNDDRLIEALRKAGETSGERLWPLPLWEDYDEQIKSSIADVKNTGGRPAGTITAAAFLKKFAGDLTWAHLDIAGTAWRDKPAPEGPAGATGVGVRLLIDFLIQLTANRTAEPF
jgi:leucyl aminopeptidase